MITIMRRYGFSLDFLSLWFIYGGICRNQKQAAFQVSNQGMPPEIKLINQLSDTGRIL